MIFRRRSGLVVLALVLLSAAGGRALAEADVTDAQWTDAQRAEYEELTKKGILEYELGHWAEAKAHFSRAHALFPNARTLRALGLIAFETRSYVEALDQLERALASQQKPLTEEMRTQVTSLAGDASSFVARFALVLDPADAQVFVDGERATLREQHVLLVDPGEHELRIEAEGWLPQSRQIRASAGQSSELKLALLAADGGGTDLRVANSEGGDGSGAAWWSVQRGVAVGLGAAAVVGFGVGVTAGLLALSAKSDSERNCDGDACNARGEARRDTALARADIATVGFVAGGALLAAGAITFFLATDPERPVSSSVRVAAGPGYAVVAIDGRL